MAQKIVIVDSDVNTEELFHSPKTQSMANALNELQFQAEATINKNSLATKPQVNKRSQSPFTSFIVKEKAELHEPTESQYFDQETLKIINLMEVEAMNQNRSKNNPLKHRKMLSSPTPNYIPYKHSLSQSKLTKPSVSIVHPRAYLAGSWIQEMSYKGNEDFMKDTLRFEEAYLNGRVKGLPPRKDPIIVEKLVTIDEIEMQFKSQKVNIELMKPSTSGMGMETQAFLQKELEDTASQYQNTLDLGQSNTVRSEMKYAEETLEEDEEVRNQKPEVEEVDLKENSQIGQNLSMLSQLYASDDKIDTTKPEHVLDPDALKIPAAGSSKKVQVKIARETSIQKRLGNDTGNYCFSC